MKTSIFRVWFILALVGLSVWVLYPTWQWSQLTTEERVEDPARAEELKSRSITLGLDLQGGIHLLLGVQTDKLKQNILLNGVRRVPTLLSERGISASSPRTEANGVEITVNQSALETRSADIEETGDFLDFFQNPEVRESPEPGQAILFYPLDQTRFNAEVEEATGRAIEIIRNRIDQFGVSEPAIQKSGNRKIVVELPGATDPRRARELIGRTAQLEFYRVKDDKLLNDAIVQINQATNSSLTGLVASDQVSGDIYNIRIVNPEQRAEVARIFNSPSAREALPPGSEVHFGLPEELEGKAFIPLLLLEDQAAMTGEDLEMARPAWNERGQYEVVFEFGSDGARDFGELTSELMHGEKRLAVVLDGTVVSAPRVQSRITRSGRITGNFDMSEAKDLAVVLRSGALPAPVEILEDRTVGASLGADSVQKGAKAVIVGFAIVVLVMLIRYKLAGLIANVALFLNFLFVFALLAYFGATLTLPGLAGIILAIGMAVDANILIFERTREELAAGKGVYSAVNAGYEKAFSTILDANVTTLVTAAALYEFGTGPIRGFAVTLSIGIICSMFTALYVARTIFDRTVLAQKNPRLSI